MPPDIISRKIMPKVEQIRATFIPQYGSRIEVHTTLIAAAAARRLFNFFSI